jgi:cytochrome c oxidase cbb3-type subunit I/II
MSPAAIASNVHAQATEIADDLRKAGAYVAPEKEVVALIAYLRHLGRFEAVGAPATGAKTAALAP